MRNYLNYLVITAALVNTGVNIFAQEKIHVLKKIISKEYAISEIPYLQIKGEKSDIILTGWKNNSVKIEIQLIAKNPEKVKAEKDIQFMNYTLVKKDNKIMLSNSFLSTHNVRITSNLSVKFIVHLPEQSIVKVENLYGNITISNLNQESTVKNSFGEVFLNNIKGTLYLTAYYADSRLSGCDAKIVCKADNSELYFSVISNTVDITSSYGNIAFNPGIYLKKLTIKSSRTEIAINVDRFDKYSYSLLTQNSSLNLPGNYSGKIIRESKIQRFYLTFSPSNPSMTIETSYCPITINSINK